ncbi:uncharacterized protein N7529_006069 [Penicillium soppii]|jgi:hypothetical protein|uniref:uncharacterized protein n=1 Tax=Penicillium soppii TaxID=69789 RepID=UPI0025490953|nr:uncharacterized protein N7529_006069 [Penicillium soppii]KAJ5864153.1 hypothetical protein N7529_006069 [Penicillium soppii]
MNPTQRSPGRIPRYRPPSDEEDDSDDELVRPGSSGSDASSNVTTVSAAPLTPLNTQLPGSYFPPQSRSASATTSPHAFPMPNTARRPSGRPSVELPRHRSRHHSQGFFEPSLPTASSDQVSTASASRIAAQTAMQQKRHVPAPMEERPRRSGSASPPLMPAPLRINQPSPQPPSIPGNVATTAANVVFPRAGVLPEQQPEKQKKKKLFSKPKHIGISSHRDFGKDRGLPSPSKIVGLSRMVSGSTTNLADLASNNSSMYNLSNASVSTVVPADHPAAPEKEKDNAKEKDKHKHHFLSRQKLKLKDRVDDHFNLPLSSASSNSRPADPNAPKSLYSFTSPATPAPGAAFGKSVSGLDLLHGGRALREKKKEERALAAETEQMEWLANNAGPTTPGFTGPSSIGSAGPVPDSILRETLQGFGLNNMTPEDAWDFLKAKLLVIFDGEDVRIAIEDLNKLVLVHLQRCVHKRAPTSIIMDLQELLETGFATLNHSSLLGIPDEKLVPHLVQIWMLVFGTILPFIQAVFLPLDLEFKGCGSIMTSREAGEFWGVLPAGGTLDVRNLVLIAFRDCIILNRYDTLKATFSRLSLDSINSGFPTLSVTSKSTGAGGRPGTAASLDAGFGSYNSQSSTLLSTVDSYSSDHPRPTSSASRSRAQSNTSSNADVFFNSVATPPTSNRPTIIHRANSADTSHVITETVGRMLQCVSVLASIQSDDPAQERIEVLSKALKHNWLGRGRTGRDRRGFVGAKIRPVMVGGPPVIEDGYADSLTTAGISIGASTSTGGSRTRGDSSSSDWSGGFPAPGSGVSGVSVR